MSNRRKQWVPALGAVAFLALGIAGAIYGTGCSKKTVTTDPAAKVEEIRTGPFVVRVQESGTLEALISVEVKSNVEGEVIELNVAEGDIVEQGFVLLRIDDEEIVEEVTQAQANYDASVAQMQRAKEDTRVTILQLDAQLAQAAESVLSAQASMESAEQSTMAQIGQAETDISTSENTLERDNIALSQAEISLQQLNNQLQQQIASASSSKIAYENAQREFERTQELFDKKFVSRSALESAQERATSTMTSYDNGEQGVANQRKSIESQEANIEAQKRVISSRQTTLKFQKSNLETLKASRNAAERQQKSSLQVAQSRLQELNDTIEAQKRIAALSETSAEAAVLRTKSALDFAKKRLNWTTVTASMSGTVTNLDIEAGEIITSGRSAFSSGPPIMTIADLSKMIVRVPINEVDMGQIRIGQRAEITVSAFPGKKFPGLIYQIAPSGLVSENVVRFQVEIEVVGSPPELLPGMTADVDIFVVDRPDALQAPIEAVLEDDAVGIFVAVPDTEMAQLNQGETVKVETRLGKQVNARLSSVSNPVRLTLLDDTKSWRPGPVEFSIVTSAGGRIASLSGNVTQTKSYYVEVPDGEPTPEGPPKANKVTVDVGVKNEGFYEVLSGVSPGTKVLVRPPRADANPFGRPGGR